MRTQALSPHTTAGPWDSAFRTARGRLICEISERIIEWSDLEGRPRVFRWLSRLGTIAGDPESSEALWLYLRLSTGDLGQLTKTFTELGGKHNRTKQAEAQETERALRVIQRHFPEVADAIEQLLHPRGDHERAI